MSAGPALAQAPSAPAPSPAAPPEPPAAPEPEPPAPREPDEAEAARGQPIAEVLIAGHRRMLEEDVRGYLQSMRAGGTFTPEGLRTDLQELWASGFFDDIQVDLGARDDGVHLRLLVRERPTIAAIEITGNHEIDKEDLLEAMSEELRVGSILSHPAIARATEKLRGKYAEEGYLLAEVSHEVDVKKGEKVTIRFTVREQEKVTVRRITFIGNAKIPESELREIMITGKAGLLELGTGGAFRKDAFERDILAIQALYYDKGFLSVEVGTPRVMLTPDRRGVELAVSITEGPRYRIRRMKVYEQGEDGLEVEPLGGRRHLRELVRAKPGEHFNRAELVKDLGAIQTMYRDAGYANVEVPPETELDPAKETVDITIAVRRREPVHFGRIEIRGNTKTRDKVIRREMEIEEGQLFSETKLARSRGRILSLGYFESADFSTEQGAAPGTLDVHVEVAEKPTGTFQLGAGFSSAESFIGTAQIQQQNLFGTGRSLSLQAQISGTRQLIDFSYFDPYFLDSRFSLALSGYNQLRAYESFAQRSKGGSITVGYPLRYPELRASLTYTLQSDRVSTTDTSTLFGTASAVSVFERLPLANLFNDGLTSSLRPSITYDTRNNQLFPSSGIYLQGSVEAASPYLGSENEFYRFHALGRFYYPVNASGSVVLKLNAEAGLVVSPSPEGVPIFARYFLGGINDVRGFPLRSLGPRLPLRASLDENAPAVPNGANIGGNLMYHQNLELEFPILSAVGIRGVLFTDLGNAWNLESLYCRAAPSSPHAVTNPCFSPSSLLNVRASVGAGIRWQSPLGPLRFEWGFPIKRLPYEEPSKFEFTIGGFF